MDKQTKNNKTIKLLREENNSLYDTIDARERDKDLTVFTFVTGIVIICVLGICYGFDNVDIDLAGEYMCQKHNLTLKDIKLDCDSSLFSCDKINSLIVTCENTTRNITSISDGFLVLEN
jgi:hypothetical protein